MDEAHEVTWTELETATSETPFVRESFELLKDVIEIVTLVASLRPANDAKGLSRDQAIIVGHFARMVKLMLSLVRQISDGHPGDQQVTLNREFMDSLATVLYLLDDPGDGSRFTSYVMDSLISEREFLKDVREQIAQRGDVMLPIEKRINRSIQETLDAAGVTEAEVPGRRSNGWPSAETRFDLISPTAYDAYRTGSGVIHGSFSTIFRHHVEAVESGGFEVDFRHQPFRPQPLLAIARMALMPLGQYVARFLTEPLPNPLRNRIVELDRTLRTVDAMHEDFLNRPREGR